MDLQKKNSIKEFIKDKKYLFLRAFNKNDQEAKKTFNDALCSYVTSKEQEPEFSARIKIDTYLDLYWNKPSEFGKTSIDLFMENILKIYKAVVKNIETSL